MQQLRHLAMLVGAALLTVSLAADAGGPMPSAVRIALDNPKTANPSKAPKAEDLNGRAVDPLAASADARAVVLLFVSVDCPISNRYAPEVSRLERRYASQHVKIWLVYSNPLETPERIREHVRSFGYAAAVLRDPRQVLAKWAGATITPEAVVYDRQGKRVYRGRIDDRYISLGRERPTATRRDLDEALAATLAGRRIDVPVAQAVGCYISDFAQ